MTPTLNYAKTDSPFHKHSRGHALCEAEPMNIYLRNSYIKLLWVEGGCFWVLFDFLGFFGFFLCLFFFLWVFFCLVLVLLVWFWFFTFFFLPFYIVSSLVSFLLQCKQRNNTLQCTENLVRAPWMMLADFRPVDTSTKL